MLPPDAEERENDYVLLSDIFPMGYHATELAGTWPGDSVLICGAGPAGLMAALSATIKGASRIMVVDMHKDRFALAEKLGAKNDLAKRGKIAFEFGQFSPRGSTSAWDRPT